MRLYNYNFKTCTFFCGKQVCVVYVYMLTKHGSVSFATDPGGVVVRVFASGPGGRGFNPIGF